MSAYLARFREEGYLIHDCPLNFIPFEVIDRLITLNDKEFSNEELFREEVLHIQATLNNSLFHHQVVKAHSSLMQEIAESSRLFVSGIAFLRVVRPVNMGHHYEYLDFHRESFYGTGDFVHHQINLHLPIMGYSSSSAMKYVPFSHRLADTDFTLLDIPESITEVERGSTKHRQGYLYRPKRIVSGCDLNSAKPFPVSVGQIAVFKSDLVHGGGVNHGNKLRVSTDFAIIAAKHIDLSKNHQLASLQENKEKYVEIV